MQKSSDINIKGMQPVSEHPSESNFTSSFNSSHNKITEDPLLFPGTGASHVICLLRMYFRLLLSSDLEMLIGEALLGCLASSTPSTNENTPNLKDGHTTGDIQQHCLTATTTNADDNNFLLFDRINGGFSIAELSQRLQVSQLVIRQVLLGGDAGSGTESSNGGGGALAALLCNDSQLSDEGGGNDSSDGSDDGGEKEEGHRHHHHRKKHRSEHGHHGGNRGPAWARRRYFIDFRKAVPCAYLHMSSSFMRLLWVPSGSVVSALKYIQSRFSIQQKDKNCRIESTLAKSFVDSSVTPPLIGLSSTLHHQDPSVVSISAEALSAKAGTLLEESVQSLANKFPTLVFCWKCKEWRGVNAGGSFFGDEYNPRSDYVSSFQKSSLNFMVLEGSIYCRKCNESVLIGTAKEAQHVFEESSAGIGRGKNSTMAGAFTNIIKHKPVDTLNSVSGSASQSGNRHLKITSRIPTIEQILTLSPLINDPQQLQQLLAFNYLMSSPLVCDTDERFVVNPEDFLTLPEYEKRMAHVRAEDGGSSFQQTDPLRSMSLRGRPSEKGRRIIQSGDNQHLNGPLFLPFTGQLVAPQIGAAYRKRRAALGNRPIAVEIIDNNKKEHQYLIENKKKVEKRKFLPPWIATRGSSSFLSSFSDQVPEITPNTDTNNNNTSSSSNCWKEYIPVARDIARSMGEYEVIEMN